MGKTHKLKILPKYLKPIEEGIKTFEIRFNDRDYQVGDRLILQEYTRYGYTGRYIEVIVTYITDYEQTDNRIVMAIVKA